MKKVNLELQIDDAVYGLLEEGLAQNPQKPSVPDLLLSFIKQGVGQAAMKMAQSKVSISKSAVATVVEGPQGMSPPIVQGHKVLESIKK